MSTFRAKPSSLWLINSAYFFVVLILMPTLLGMNAFAQTSGNALSKAKIIALKNAGVSDAVLIQQIQRNGIDFGMDPDTTLELKNSGVSNEVLQSLLSAKVSRTERGASVVGPEINARAQELYRAGKYEDLADYLKKNLSANPSDYKSRTFLILSLLKLKDDASANQEFSELTKSSQDPNARKYVEKVESVFALLEKQKEGKSKILTALKNFNAQEASTAIEQLPASPLQREYLNVILDSYSGNFDSAHARLSKLNPDSFAAKQQLKAIDDRVKQTQDEYTKAVGELEVYIHSPLAPSSCFGPSGAWNHSDYYKLTIPEYLNTVSSLVKLAPLSDFALNSLFHAEMLVGDYPELENLGDRILSAKGEIRLPFFSKDKYFDVVIDSKKRRIYSVPSPLPFVVQYALNGSGWSPAGHHQGAANHNDWNADLVPFDLSFAEITSVTQHVPWGHTTMDYIKGRPYVLKFSPIGQAPNYAVMLLLGCTAGSEAQMRATRNLGQYVVHVIGKKNLLVELVDPSKKPSNYGWMLGAMTAFYGGVASQTGNTALADANANLHQMISTEQAKGDATRQYQLQTASALLDDQTTFLSDDSFANLESLLGLL